MPFEHLAAPLSEDGQCRRYCFVQHELSFFNDMIQDPPHPSVAYICVSIEKTPTSTTGAKHIQGYVEMNAKVRYKTLNKGGAKWPPYLVGAHFEGARATLFENQLYIQKLRDIDEWRRETDHKDKCEPSEDYHSIGTPLPTQGQRADLKRLSSEVYEGRTDVKRIRLENPHAYHQFGRTLEKIETDRMNDNRRTEMTKGLWLYGKTGSGKSRLAFDIAGDRSTYCWKTNERNGWQDGYKQQEVVIVDDFRGTIPYDELLRIVDRYDYSMIRRGTEPVNFTSKLVIITCPMIPERIYRNREMQDSIEQLHRRFIVQEMDITRYEEIKESVMAKLEL